ncbi:MAG TPA: PAS domain S-box protein [Geothrix sp.]|jgi:PAS domain S-box-containing protein
MTGPESTRPPDSAAVQFMILDFLEEILKFSESPGEMGQFLTRQLREVLGTRTVLLLQHDQDRQEGPARIVALEPERARSAALLSALERLARLHPDRQEAAFLLRASATPDEAALMDELGLASLSMTPLRVGGWRVGTLFALDHLDFHRTEDVVRLLSVLSPVFALILRNTLHFESQEAKVLAQAEEYQALLRTNLDGYLVVDGDGRIRDANGAYLHMSGYSLEEIRGLHVTHLDALESREETDRHSEKMKREGSDRFTSIHRRKDGTTFPIEASTTYVPNQNLIIAFIRDLTDRVAAETALRESEAHHRELVEILGEGVAITDASETIIMANLEADRIFGLPRDQLIGKSLRTFLDDADWARVIDHTLRRQDGHTDSYQIRIRRTDGAWRTVQITATPRCDAGGQFTGSLAVFRDVTEELKTQEALRLAQKMESLGNLAGGLAHDMNNVLGAILGLATTHLDLQPEGTRLHTTFETITKACLRGRNMVKALLDFARKDMAGERSVSINSLIQDEARLLERTIPANIQIRLDLDPGAGAIMGDPDALSLVLMNLCMNALDAMPDGGGLTLVTRSQPPDQVALSVTDTGSGMPPEVLDHALEPFFTTKPQGKGTGLGLSLVYSTVRAHRGDLKIHSQPGQGTTIEMRFPSAGPESGPGVSTATEPDRPPAALDILLVDDDELIRSSLEAQLEAMGHKAALATCGEDAMDLLEQGLRPAIVILDMNMPGWGGARTLPKLRAALPDVPILLSTGRADQQAIDLAHAHPGVTILAKPFGFRELQAAFAAILPER